MNDQVKGLTLTLLGSEVETLKRMSVLCVDPETPEGEERPEIYRYMHIKGKYAEATNGHVLIRHRFKAHDFEGSWLLDPGRLTPGPVEPALHYELEVLDPGAGPQLYPDTQSPIDACKGFTGHVGARLMMNSRVFLTDQLLRISMHLPPEQKPWFPARLEKGKVVLEWGVDELELEAPGLGNIERPIRLMAYYLWLAFQLQAPDQRLNMLLRPEDEDGTFYPQAVEGPFETFLIMPMKD